MATRKKTANKNTVKRTEAVTKPVVEDVVETKEPVVEATPEVEVPAETPVEAPVEEKKVEAPKPAPKAKAEPTGNPNAALKVALDNYIDIMNPKNPVSIEEGGRQQKKFRAIIINALMEPEDDLALENIKYILSVMDTDDTGVFGLRAVFRFYDTARWASKDERREIETLISLLTTVSNPKTRGAELAKMELSNLEQFIVPRRYETIYRRLTMFFGKK